jgi:hypothetical protein
MMLTDILTNLGFVKVEDNGQPVLQRQIEYRCLPQDDIEDIMSQDDIILSIDVVTLSVDMTDGDMSIECGDAYVGPINQKTPLYNKILQSLS